jgi:hypothetical protein
MLHSSVGIDLSESQLVADETKTVVVRSNVRSAEPLWRVQKQGCCGKGVEKLWLERRIDIRLGPRMYFEVCSCDPRSWSGERNADRRDCLHGTAMRVTHSENRVEITGLRHVRLVYVMFDASSLSS